MKTFDALFKSATNFLWYLALVMHGVWYKMLNHKYTTGARWDSFLYSTSTCFSIHVYIIYLDLHLRVISTLCILLFHYIATSDKKNLHLPILILWSYSKVCIAILWKALLNQIFVLFKTYMPTQLFFQEFYRKHRYFFTLVSL